MKRKVKTFLSLSMVLLLTFSLFPATIAAHNHDHVLDITFHPDEYGHFDDLIEDDIWGEITGFSEPIPIEEFLSSELAVSLDAEVRMELDSLVPMLRANRADSFMSAYAHIEELSITTSRIVNGVEIAELILSSEFENVEIDVTVQELSLEQMIASMQMYNISFQHMHDVQRIENEMQNAYVLPEYKNVYDAQHEYLDMQYVDQSIDDILHADGRIISDTQLIQPANLVADLAVWGLSSPDRQPFSFDRNYSFSFIIGNIGSLTASNVRTRLYLANNYILTMNHGFIQPNQAFQFSFNLGLNSGNVGGRHEMVVDVSTSTLEINLSNNRMSTFFEWQRGQQTADLAVLQIHSNNGRGNDQDFTAAVMQNFSASVFNFGNSPAHNSIFNLHVNGVPAVSGTLPTIPVGQSLEVFFSLRISRSGSHQFRANLQAQGIVDPNLNNNTVIRSLRAFPDGCGLWDLRFVGHNRAILLSVDDPGIPFHTVQNAVNQWSGISSSIFFNSLVVGNSSANAFITTARIPYEGVGGYFRATNTNLINRTFTHGYIAICENNWSGGNSWWDRHVMIHEIGHLLSLGHPHETDRWDGNPFCHDFAVMQGAGNNLWTDHVTEHDRVALRRRFGQ